MFSATTTLATFFTFTHDEIYAGMSAVLIMGMGFLGLVYFMEWLWNWLDKHGK